MQGTGLPLLARLEREILPLVSKPNRYVGNERGIVRKDWDAVRARMLFCFPDVYEVGMSHTGTQILYHIVNRRPEWLLERAYAPWPDMERRMREGGVPLYALESGRAACEFDVVGFTLQSELTYTNVLTMLDLAGLPLRQAERRADDPIVLTGGPCASNPEPLAPFVDAVLVGDAEDAIHEVLEVVADHKETAGAKGEGATVRERLLWRLATEVAGVYVPSLYDGPADQRTSGPEPDESARPLVPSSARPSDPRLPFPVLARTVPILRPDDYPVEGLVPVGEVVHERLPIEVQRGCVRGCRFCQAGYLYRPVRERSVEACLDIAERGIAFSGHEEVSLLSLSTADHSQAAALVETLSASLAERGVSVALPSLRADAFSVDLANSVARVRKSGFTFAPEAGSERLRRVINKGLTEPDILGAVERAMASGWQGVKLYLMIGHPTETMEDFEELAGLVGRIRAILRGQRGRRHVALSVSPFVPKAHTPFQWERQDAESETRTKLRWIQDRLRGQGVDVRYHDPAETAIEGCISRGGRETADLIEAAWRRGARFDGWRELLDFAAWRAALGDVGLTLEHAYRERAEDEALPWEVVSYGIPRQWFARERRKAYDAVETAECKGVRCSACGVCDFDLLQNVLAPPPTPVAADQRASGRADQRTREHADATEVRPSARPLVRSSAIVRVRYAKRAPLRFVGHLELMHELDRVLRRARVPMLYSEGHSARPRLSAGAPLATGWLSESEWLDLEVEGAWEAPALEALLHDLNRHAAAGLVFLAAGVLSGKGSSLMASVERSTYRATFPHPPFEWSFADLDAGCRTFLARSDAPYARDRHGRTRVVDLRPLVLDLAALDASAVVVEVRTASDGSAKPTEVLEAALGIPRERAPLIQIQKTDTRFAGGAGPLDGCAVCVGDTDVEARDPDQWQPAGDPRGDRGRRPPC
jgi:radical SAM family uncharacterized protein/radical SAM-linked protein